jgi:hypothetical protein
MKLVYLIYHDILEERVNGLFKQNEIDFFTEWEEVKGKGHSTEAHLGSRTFPGYNNVRLIAFDNEEMLVKLIIGIKKLNEEAVRKDDRIRLFQLPLETII